MTVVTKLGIIYLLPSRMDWESPEKGGGWAGGHFCCHWHESVQTNMKFFKLVRGLFANSWREMQTTWKGRLTLFFVVVLRAFQGIGRDGIKK